MSTADEQIALHVSRLKAKAVEPAAHEEPDEEKIRAGEQRAREERRQDTARRLRYPVLVQRDGEKLIFKDDLQIREGIRADPNLKHDPNPKVK
jgi:hypothetical protein